MPNDVLSGQTDAILLAAVRAESAHGYEIIERLRTTSGGVFDLREGTVYPALHRLERDGLLESRWSEHNGRRRRVYRLTGSGVAALEAFRTRWRLYARGVEAVFGAAPAIQSQLNGAGA